MNNSDVSDISLDISGGSSVNIADDSSEHGCEKVVKNLFEVFMRHKLTLKALEDTANLINSVPGAEIKLPTTKYLLVKELLSTTTIETFQFFHCKPCAKYTKCNFSDKKKTKCTICDRKFKKDDFFVYFGLKEQVEEIINKNFETITKYRDAIKNDTHIRDGYNSKHLKGIMKTNDNVWSMMLNTDGIATTNSNISSLWPILLICNFLPPEIRY